MINRKIFKEFHTDQEANEWAMNYFGTWIKDMHSNKDSNDKNNVANLLSKYTGNMNVAYNNFLRGYIKLDAKDTKEYCKKIAIIEKEICKFALQENIIVYRYTRKNFFRNLFKSLNPKMGETFIEKGFMSTTLLPNLLKDFPKKNHHNCNCILKLYLPRETKGAYIEFDKGVLNEYEFLLPPNSTFKLIRKKFSFKYWMPIYECLLLEQ